MKFTKYLSIEKKKKIRVLKARIKIYYIVITAVGYNCVRCRYCDKNKDVVESNWQINHFRFFGHFAVIFCKVDSKPSIIFSWH